MYSQLLSENCFEMLAQYDYWIPAAEHQRQKLREMNVTQQEIIKQLSQLTGKSKDEIKQLMQLQLADELDSDLVETTAHAGARPSHVVWQGQVFSLSGKNPKYPDFRSATGYGTGAGLCGWNCRHSFFPYFEGAGHAYTSDQLRSYEDKSISYNGKMYTEYEASQMQRHNERQIRRWKREYAAMEAAGLDTTEAAVKLHSWRERQRDFLEQTGLKRQGDREAAAKVVDNLVDRDIIKLDKINEDFLQKKSFQEISRYGGKLSDRAVRKWYKYHDEQIPSLIDRTESLENQARQACELRNLHRTQARDLMRDQEARNRLDQTDPNRTFEELVENKMKRKGLTKEQAYEDILKTATKTRKSVNKALGLED